MAVCNLSVRVTPDLMRHINALHAVHSQSSTTLVYDRPTLVWKPQKLLLPIPTITPNCSTPSLISSMCHRQRNSRPPISKIWSRRYGRCRRTSPSWQRRRRRSERSTKHCETRRVDGLRTSLSGRSRNLWRRRVRRRGVSLEYRHFFLH